MKKLQSILTAFLCMLFVSASAQTKSDLTTNRGSVIPSTGNNVPLNVNKNQMRLTLTSNDVKYYNTESISSVDINGGNITINPLSGSASDVYSGNVSRIAFAKAKEGGESGDINNPAGAINIQESKGWLEMPNGHHSPERNPTMCIATTSSSTSSSCASIRRMCVPTCSVLLPEHIR